MFELRIKAAPLPRSVALPPQSFLFSPPLLSALVHVALHLDPFLFCTELLLLLMILEQLLQEFGDAKEVEEDEVAEENARDEQENKDGPHAVANGACNERVLGVLPRGLVGTKEIVFRASVEHCWMIWCVGLMKGSTVAMYKSGKMT